jgi:hypothetical protein
MRAARSEGWSQWDRELEEVLDFWSNSESSRAPTKSKKGKPSPFQNWRTGPLDLYVDPLGDDSNRCDSPLKPCKTIQSAVDRIPVVIGGEVIVHIASGVYVEDVNLFDRADPDLAGVKLQGDFYDRPRIEGSLSLRRMRSILLSNLVVENSDADVPTLLVSRSDLQIIRSVVTGGIFGVLATRSDVIVSSVTFHDQRFAGLFGDYQSRFDLRYGEVSGADIGDVGSEPPIQMSAVTHSRISGYDDADFDVSGEHRCQADSHSICTP